MLLLQKGINALSDRIPKVLSPSAHAIADYAVIGGFLTMGILFWKRHRRAAIASLAIAGAELANTLITDFPGGVTDKISFETHGHVDLGLAAAASSLPEFLKFSGDPQAKFFTIMGVNISAVHAMTDFNAPVRERSYLEKTA